MQTFDQALYAAVEAGVVDIEDALRCATRPHDLKLLLQTRGQLRTTMADVMAAQEAAGPEPAEPAHAAHGGLML